MRMTLRTEGTFSSGVKFPLFDEGGFPMLLRRVQGGVFSERGHLYLLNDTGIVILGFDTSPLHRPHI
jgi:hypothetical protein